MLSHAAAPPTKNLINSADGPHVRSSGISILRGKRRSGKSWRNQEGNRKNGSEKQGRQGLD